MVKSNFAKHFFVFVFFLLAAIYVTYPLIFHLKDFALGTVDELYITWILNWNIHALSNNIFDLFNANIYYPYNFSLAFSDLHLTSALIAFLPVTIFKEPLMAYSINLILSFTLLGFFTYLLIFFLTKHYEAGIIGGTIFAFSTYTLMKTMHLQVLSSYWIPLSILFFLKYLKVEKFHYFLFTILAFYLQFLNSFLPAYFLLFMLLILTVRALIQKQINKNLIFNKKTFLIYILVILAMIPIIYPYYYTSNFFHYTRDIRETIHTANRPEYLLYSFGRSTFAPFINSALYKHPGPFIYDGYRGFASLLLTFILLVYLILKRKVKYPPFLKFFTVIGISMYVLSLGPALQWAGKVIKLPFIIPLPYALLYYLVPGFKGLRNSGRLEFFEIFAFSVAIGIFFAYKLKRKSLATKTFITILICGLVLGEFAFPMQFYKLKSHSEIPEVYKFISTTPSNSAIAEFPIYNWSMLPYSLDENLRLYYSTFHFRKTINGGGGFSPYPWQDTVISLASHFPDQQSIQILKNIGINYVIVHEKEFNKLHSDDFKVNSYVVPDGATVSDILSKSKIVDLLYSSNQDSVYKIKY